MAPVSVFGRVLRLAVEAGYLVPPEGRVNVQPMTCYTFGVLGKNLCHNLREQWQSSMRNQSCVRVSTEGVSNTKDAAAGLSSSAPSYHYLHQLASSADSLPCGISYAVCSPHLTGTAYTDIISSSADCTRLTVQWLVPANMTARWITDWQLHRLRWWKKFAVSPVDFRIQSHAEDSTSSIEYKHPKVPLVVEEVTNLQEKPLLEMPSEQLHMNIKSGNGSLPHVVQSVFLLEHGALAYLTDAYHLAERMPYSQQSSSSAREVMKLHRKLCPYKVCILAQPGGCREYKAEVADYVRQDLQQAGFSVNDQVHTKSSPQQLYQQSDMQGTPFSVEATEETLSTGLVLLRNRDTTLQEQVLLTQLTTRLAQYVDADDECESNYEDVLLV